MSRQQSTESGPGRGSGLALAGTIGGYVVLCLALGLGAGFLLDRVFGTAPLLLISGVVLGFAVSFYLTYKLAMREIAD